MILSDSDTDWLPIFGLLASILGHARPQGLTLYFKVYYAYLRELVRDLPSALHK
jgi:hypothetical protein